MRQRAADPSSDATRAHRRTLKVFRGTHHAPPPHQQRVIECTAVPLSNQLQPPLNCLWTRPIICRRSLLLWFGGGLMDDGSLLPDNQRTRAPPPWARGVQGGGGHSNVELVTWKGRRHCAAHNPLRSLATWPSALRPTPPPHSHLHPPTSVQWPVHGAPWAGPQWSCQAQALSG